MKRLKDRLLSWLPARYYRGSDWIDRVRNLDGWPRLAFPLFGLGATIWFLMRVVPKPSRATYPCQRLAFPVASGFVVWLVGVVGASLAFHEARSRFRRAQFTVGMAAVLVALVGVVWSVAATASLPVQAYTAHPTNEPMGIARGLAPGRVTWVHDPDVTDWNGPGTSQRWYDHVETGVANQMLSDGLQSYTGSDADNKAWAAIFNHYKRGKPYLPGEKVFIKVNFTTSYAGSGTANIDSDYNWNPQSPLNFDSIGEAPQLMIALLSQLVHVVGVSQSDITIGDTTGLWANEFYNPVYAEFPSVVYMDNYGPSWSGRTRATLSSVELHWSTIDAAGTDQDYLPTTLASADYVIDLAILKSHDSNGFTVTAKNHFGSMLRTPLGSLRGVSGNWLNLHNYLPLDSRCTGACREMGQYRPIVDLNGHEHVGGKTILYLVDGIFGGESWDSAPEEWMLPPFGDGTSTTDWPSSLFLSMDQVAIDSVAHDFLAEQWPNHVLAYEGVQDYMHEMALADDPPSGSYYDPEADGSYLRSLGVHEHWNNSTDKEYSRNLGTGNGIELVYVGDVVSPTPTPTSTPIPSGEVLLSSNSSGSVGSVVFDDEDILSFDEGSGTWSMFFDGSDLGVSTDVNAFHLLSDGDLLLSFDRAVTIAGFATVDDSDIVRFTPGTLGPNTTGTFSWFFDGSDVGLTRASEDIDAISYNDDGNLVVSTTGSAYVPGVAAADEDLLEFTASLMGATTVGSWAMYFDGSDVSLSQTSGEDVNASWINATTGQIYLSTVGDFVVPGIAGTSSDIFICAPSNTGSNTVCTYGPGFYWDGSAHGFGEENMDALAIDP